MQTEVFILNEDYIQKGVVLEGDITLLTAVRVQLSEKS